MRRTLAASLTVLLLAILACNVPAALPQEAADAVLTQVAAALTAAPTAAPAATVPGAPSPTSTPSGACNAVSFVADVTIPDDTVIGLSKPFTKTWRLKNVGTCTWTSGYSLVFDSGDQMSGPGSQQLTNGTVLPGATIDVSVDLTAPGSAGTYKGNWRLREPGGAVFGLSTGPFWVQIKTQNAVVELPSWPIRKNGDSGAEVFALQYLLVAQGENLTVDGAFGPITKTKVQHFQSTNGLTADGIVGAQTWPKLIIQVQNGSHSQAVRAVQKLLNAKYGYSLSIDGIFGPDTLSAVKDFQSDHGLASDGIVGPQTWRWLIGG